MGVDVGTAVVTMVDRAFLTRLRAGDGPSHRLLVLLDRHRVMTTGQLARATDAPDRTVRYRLERLREARLVDCARPGRESRSAPRHWWLRPAGARIVAGTAAAEGKPAGMFVAHAAAITEVWLSLVEHGGSAGVTMDSWLTDRAGWQEWDGTGPWSRRHRLTPDAVAGLALAGGAESTAVFIEVDLASMTQTLLRQKVERYLAYTTARAWDGVFAQCPPLLLLTKTATRAATFVRTARSLLEQHERRYGGADPADEPVVAACGLVLEPARAVTEACWMLSDVAASEVTLAEILTERLDAHAASQAWRQHQQDVVQRRADLDCLQDLQRSAGLADRLGSQRAVQALQTLVGTDPDGFLDAEPELARRIIDWGTANRRLGKLEAREAAAPLVTELEDRHEALWTGQAQALLAAEEHLAAVEPVVCRLAAVLATGALGAAGDLAVLGAPAPAGGRERLQQHAYGDYPQRRAAAAEAEWRALDRRERRQTSPKQLAARYDAEHLLVCDTCRIAVPLPEPDQPFVERCAYCDGTLLDWDQRGQVPSLAARLDTIRARLAELGVGEPAEPGVALLVDRQAGTAAR